MTHKNDRRMTQKNDQNDVQQNDSHQKCSLEWHSAKRTEKLIEQNDNNRTLSRMTLSQSKQNDT